MDKKILFDPAKIKIEGSSIIEASAGTGKTYNISKIFLRLICEEAIDIRNILIVTFTEAATSELREKLFSVLSEYCEQVNQPDINLRRAKNALRMFDEANVYTIHGFFNKVLTENAFESGVDFDTEIVKDNSVMKEVVYRFFRTYLVSDDLCMIEILKKTGVTIDTLLNLPFQAVNKNNIIHIDKGAPIDKDKLNSLIDEIQKSCRFLEKSLISNIPEIVSSLSNAVKKNKYKTIPGDITSIAGMICEFTQNISSIISIISTKDYETLKKYRISFLRDYVLKNADKESIEREEFHVIEKICECMDSIEQDIRQYKDHIIHSALQIIPAEIESEKRLRGMMTYDDMITMAWNALDNPAFVKAIQRRYKVLLIDEFQDTDDLQYRIFRTLFISSEENVSFMIGDPKQSIYRFRGADIYAYISACKNSQKYTLDRNFRSEEGLINAFNAIFSGMLPFGLADLEYNKVSHPGDDKEGEENFVCAEKGSFQTPCEIVFIPSQDKQYNKVVSTELVRENIVKDILSLNSMMKSKKVMIGTRPLENRDIAVLVATNKEAITMKTVLAGQGIPCVLKSSVSVF
ncbi:MAG: UvrD-helicase domain-containing protein, partial [Candidatus Muiribacteriaceae bacterium]